MFTETLIGQIINGYEIISEIARGGMATVYRANQISMNRDVAIKVLPREFLHETAFLERFKQEAAIAARLEHRAIVPVYDYGEWKDTPYIIMRYMEGGSVDKLLESGPVPLEQTQQIIRQVASALDHAHKQGVLHRDLKPSNILLDRNQDAYISDFGIARLMESDVKLTATGVVGTPAYMSPEQAQGFELDGRSDQYSLAVVAFEMLTGRRPFEGDTPYSIAVMHVTKPAPSPRQYKPELAIGVEKVILRALEKDPNKRYKNSVEFAGALDDADLLFIGEESELTIQATAVNLSFHSQPTPRRPSQVVSAIPAPSPTYGVPTPRRRNSGMSYLFVAVMIAVIAALVLLGGYMALPDNVEGNQPDFAATGAARLTATHDSLPETPYSWQPR